MAVAQLVERSFPTTEIRSSNPYIGKVLSTSCTLNRKGKKEKEVGKGRLYKKDL